MKLLITGGAGFIGSNFVHHMLAQHPGWKLVVLDKLTYAGNLKNLEPALREGRCEFVQMDICDRGVLEAVRGCDAVVHFAAESHVDRSIEDASAFVRTNVDGTHNLLQACRQATVPRFVHVSTDEVYGSLGETGQFFEDTPLKPNSPYSATKAASDLLVLAYVHTYKFPGIVTRCSNNYGPYQFPEKFIPLMIAQAMAGERLPVYGKGANVRDWIHVRDHCTALDAVLQGGREGEVYNIGGGCEMRNLEVAKLILKALGRPEDLIQFVTDRPGHDLRYAINCEKLGRELGWRPQVKFEQGLADTIAWYRNHPQWLDEVRSGQYRDYYQRHYVHREKTFAQKS
ncbi:MAG TPA: dTDP-glucose 4,6-dehydratase [Terriglobales bacterium]|nr:dTDP-glucose 4,6-dehydratase [Terriglobales bacterium]